jgi:hypothetical protein
MPQEPQGSCGSPVDPPVPESVKDPGAPARCVMVRPDVSGESAGGDGAGESLRHGSGMMRFEEGLESLWDHGHGTRACGLKRLEESGVCDLVFVRVRGRDAPESRGRSGRGDASRPSRSKGTFESKPQERQRAQRARKTEGRATRRGGEKPRGRNCGGRGNPASYGSPRSMSLEGRETPGGASRSCWTGEDVATRTLRGRRSLWKLSCGLRAVRWSRSAEHLAAVETARRERQPMTPLRRSERFERQQNPARVVRSTATCARNSRDEGRNP